MAAKKWEWAGTCDDDNDDGTPCGEDFFRCLACGFVEHDSERTIHVCEEDE